MVILQSSIFSSPQAIVKNKVWCELTDYLITNQRLSVVCVKSTNHSYDGDVWLFPTTHIQPNTNQPNSSWKGSRNTITTQCHGFVLGILRSGDSSRNGSTCANGVSSEEQTKQKDQRIKKLEAVRLTKEQVESMNKLLESITLKTSTITFAITHI
jgi:hypothetical protein